LNCEAKMAFNRQTGFVLTSASGENAMNTHPTIGFVWVWASSSRTTPSPTSTNPPLASHRIRTPPAQPGRPTVRSILARTRGRMSCNTSPQIAETFSGKKRTITHHHLGLLQPLRSGITPPEGEGTLWEDYAPGRRSW
jgi:hypothetical protein